MRYLDGNSLLYINFWFGTLLCLEDGLGLARWAGGGDIEIYNGMLERGSHNLALVGVLRGR